MKKYIFIALAAIAALSSCAKESLVSNDENGKEAQVFTATMEDGITTKVTFDATNKCALWEVGDAISIDSHTYTAEQAGASSTFTGSGATESTHHAYFPANLYNGGTPTLPAALAYAEGKFNMPMYAESSSLDLSFRNLCGVLAITVKGTDFTSVSSIEVSSDKQMNGEFTATAEGVLTFASASLTDALKKVTLTFNTAKSIASDGSATFYIPVPADTHNPLAIKVTGGSTTAIMVTKKSGGVGVSRNTVYPITFSGQAITGEADVKADAGILGNKVKWVQLWENGPKFAEVNVGVTDGNAESYGGYYTWGGTYNNDPNLSGFSWNDDHNTDSSELSHTGNDITDTATNLWGSNWRMPTKVELDNLLSNCTVAWTNVNGKDGRKFTGKGAYASNSVFLPAVGYCIDGSISYPNYGSYWSSTPKSDSAYRLNFASSAQIMQSLSRGQGCSVRAVLAE